MPADTRNANFGRFSGHFGHKNGISSKNFKKCKTVTAIFFNFTLEYIFIFIEKMIFLIFRIKKRCRRGLGRALCKNQFFGFSLKGIGLESNFCAPSERAWKMLPILFFNQLSSSNGMVFTVQIVNGACTILNGACTTTCPMYYLGCKN